MLRKSSGEKVVLYRENPETLNYQSELRDKLYLFGLQFGSKIASAYNQTQLPYDKLPHLTNRAFDIWLPLFKIGETIQDGNIQRSAFDSIDRYSQADVRRKMRCDFVGNDSTTLLIALEEMMKELKPLRTEYYLEYFDPNSFHFFLEKGAYLARGMQKKALSRFLKRTLDIESVPKSFGELTKRLYSIDLTLLNKYRKRYLDPSIERKV